MLLKVIIMNSQSKQISFFFNFTQMRIYLYPMPIWLFQPRAIAKRSTAMFDNSILNLPFTSIQANLFSSLVHILNQLFNSFMLSGSSDIYCMKKKRLKQSVLRYNFYISSITSIAVKIAQIQSIEFFFFHCQTLT